MKIMILTNSSNGLWGFRQELIKELLKKNEVIAITPYDGFVEELNELGCKTIELSIDRRGLNPIKDMKFFLDCLKIIQKEKPNLVITYTIKPNVYGGFVCRLKKIPYAINITGLGTAFEKEGLLKKIAIIMNKVSCKKARVVFFENEENRQFFVNEQIVKESQTYRLNGAGINLERFKMLPYPKGDTIKFLFMGRVMAEKGIDELFIAMQKLASEGIKCELDVLGRYEENYKEIIHKYEEDGWLHYYGYQEDVRPFIEKCHCFVLPSWHEGMANTNLESAASGRPIITSNIHGCLEAVIENKSGFLVEKKNAEELYLAMKKFACLPYEERLKMGVLARKHMENVFDKKIVVKDTIMKLM